MNDRLEPLIHRRVTYTVTNQDGIYTAHTEDEQWNARKRMAQVERTASELYGFAYADQLHKKYLDKKA